MTAQSHQILRQVLELRGCPEGAAQRLQAELRGVYYRRLVPLIEKACSDLGAPGRIDRIETLEIDLGEVPLDGLEGAMAERFEARFARCLAEAIGEAPPARDAELELFELFVRTGTVPWWAERADRALLESVLERLIERAPQALWQALRAAGTDAERVRRRIALAFPDRLLERFATVLGSPSPAAPWIAALEAASRARGLTARTARNAWWEEVLHALQAGHGTAAGANAALFLEAVLARVAWRLGIGYPRLIEELRRVMAAAPVAVPPAARAVMRRLSRAVAGGRRTMTMAESTPARLEQKLARLEALLAAHPGLLARLREIRRLPARLQEQAAASLEAAVFEAGLAGPQQAKESGRAAGVSVFSDADQIPVENAGLVILWPFLERFFGHLGLLAQRAFKDEAARQRALGLLQYLATGEEPAAEHLLPLNKLLCGLPVEEVFDFGEPMTPAEREACDELLGAVIAQAPILREMSIAGFRASFLLRPGLLGARDENWLLRVERLTHDVVLDRFPWSVGIVKLPWMQAVMQVEW